jgi:hypothetical protein
VAKFCWGCGIAGAAAGSADGAESGVGSFSLGSSFGSIGFLAFVLGGDEFKADHALDSAFDFVDLFHIFCVVVLPFGDPFLFVQEGDKIMIRSGVFS